MCFKPNSVNRISGVQNLKREILPSKLPFWAKLQMPIIIPAVFIGPIRIVNLATNINHNSIIKN